MDELTVRHPFGCVTDLPVPPSADEEDEEEEDDGEEDDGEPQPPAKRPKN